MSANRFSLARDWEPTRRLPLKWGHYADRYFAGLVLIIAGAVHLQGANNYTLIILLIGTTATVVGWSIMPAKGWRRMIVALPAVSQIWIMLTGPMSMWTLAIPLLCWLIVRHRPLISYLALTIPVANGIVLTRFYQEYSSMPQALAISAVALVAAAWVAQLIAQSAAMRR
ncbi:hypothetical protein CLV85_0772 [Salinibacterium amurskyense]|uniref:Uncharacterized protein n=1 Tax=Salinibacterium amurskyense TaxID=205941 RepID=A0A2M9D7A0_9MICO|nr:hypothetical protein [Salinibacterium amurskyense]PJJ81595.1 hypothetical protein CLV85_0772 [Salinibacterium amurskyense]RLQ83580.1 hypothetical protein D9C83_03830 [Salinibacterium amurskyense]GHD79972.1 hypothetical protein GCM10007394_10410 [Salinibacterium amurskyense]